MADREDDSYIQGFLARAKMRQAKLAEQRENQAEASRTTDNKCGSLVSEQPSYPALSPLPEEVSLVESKDSEVDENQSRFESVGENGSDLNYSSDLSLECNDEQEIIYRAEPIVCESSPEQKSSQVSFVRASPRKIGQTMPIGARHHEAPTPLVELQHETVKPSSSHSLPEAHNSIDQKIKDLQLKVDRSEQARSQLKKVVELSKYGSKEHIEVARMLQITELEHFHRSNQLRRLRDSERNSPSDSLGSIRISEIRLRIGSKLINDLAEDHICHYFFCVASYGAEVKATELICTNDIRSQDVKKYLQFKEAIAFTDLPPDFSLKIEVFELVIGQQLPKLLSRLTPSKKTKFTPENHFKRVGSILLHRVDRDISYKNLTQFSKSEESKYIERECKLKIELKPEQLVSKSGMLHVRCLDSEGRPDWNRYWVSSANGRISFWKSKQDSLDGRKPNQVLEFADLRGECVQKLTPDDDLYRQNSFVLYTFQQVAAGETDNLFQKILKDSPHNKLAKHQLAADSKEERDSWCAILDKSMHCFRQWHGEAKDFKKTEFTIASLKEIFSSPC